MEASTGGIGPADSTELCPKFVQLARRVMKAEPVICDIGSRDAREGIALMQLLNGKHLHVFEPNPNAAAVCRQNLLRFAGGRPDIFSLNEAAVADTVGELKFYPVNVTLSTNKDVGFSSLFQVNPAYTKRRGSIVQDEVIVKALTLDQYFLGKDYPDVLWIDVEGAELKVFQGANRVLESVKLIHVEVSFRPMHVGKPLFWEVSEYLSRRGFRFHGFMEISSFKSFLYRHRLAPNLPWRLNAVFFRSPD